MSGPFQTEKFRFGACEVESCQKQSGIKSRQLLRLETVSTGMEQAALIRAGPELTAGTARGVGELELIESILSGWGAALMSVLTQLGDFWFLTALLGLCFWRLPEQRASVVALFATALGGFGLYRALKYAFEFPRPEVTPIEPAAVPELFRPLYENAIAAGGYGFPSGHATTATILYVGLVFVVPIGTGRQRVAGAAGTIAVVCFSRIALGVHNLVDVIGGIGTGLLALAVLFVLPNRYLPGQRVFVALVAAVPLAGSYVLASGGDKTAVQVAGLAVVTMIGWWAFDR
ncbi:MAG: membrane-associated phospholipid phosphatase [Natronomonas sp.]|jgi:membrane-associated phospholipid phosphatase